MHFVFVKTLQRYTEWSFLLMIVDAQKWIELLLSTNSRQICDMPLGDVSLKICSCLSSFACFSFHIMFKYS
uniref:Putative ovule protein n=1 Tax=Solanum chacoense TaxID=4108 RepID=A0A0V0H1G3_SOLCH